MDWSDEHILREVARIKYLYKMKDVFRFDKARDPWKRAESNAEHLYGMMVLVNYFLPLEDPEGSMDRQRIMDMILVHDLDEIEHGDIVSYKKTDADRAREKQDMATALDTMPQHMAFDARECVIEYEEQETPEARFTKAIDKLEPSFEVFDKYGKEVMRSNKTTLQQHMAMRDEYFDGYPYIKRFNEVLAEEMNKQGFFHEEK